MRNRAESLGRRMTMSMTTRGGGSWLPPADVLETAAAIFVYMDVSGVETDDLDVVVEAERLTVAGERRFPGRDLRGVHHLEIDYGKFRRTIALPAAVDVKAAAAALKNGVLTVSLPKLGPSGRVMVRVTAGPGR